MFALHETTQRRVCRVTFLLVCVVPTLLTLIGVAYCNRPWRQADWQRTLAQRFHVRATLDNISRPRPGKTTLTKLQLADLRTNLTLGSIGKISFEWRNSRLALHADHLEIQASQLPALASAVGTWLATNEPVPLDFHADQLTIGGPTQQPVLLKNLSITNVTAGPQNQRFQLTAHNDADEVIKLELKNEQGTLSCVVDTQQAPLPAWLIGELVPGVGGCGKAEFSGVITAESKNQRSRGTLKGQLLQVDLRTWIGTAGPHRLQGKAQVDLKQLAWEEDGIKVARGSINAVSGACSYSLLLNARDLCRCVPGPEWENLRPATQDELVPFDLLAFSFQMTSTGFNFAGQCEDGSLMTTDGAPLLLGPPLETMLSVGQIVQLLDYPLQPGWLPATRSAHAMAEKLPLPENGAPKPKELRK